MSRGHVKNKVLPEGHFSTVGHAVAEGYHGYEVILFPVNAMLRQSKQRILFYAVSDEEAMNHCTAVCGELSYRLYKLTLLSVNGRTE